MKKSTVFNARYVALSFCEYLLKFTKNFFINHISAFKWLKDFKYVVHNYMDYFSDANHHTESRQYGRANYDFKKNVFIIFDVVLRHLVAF